MRSINWPLFILYLQEFHFCGALFPHVPGARKCLLGNRRDSLPYSKPGQLWAQIFARDYLKKRGDQLLFREMYTPRYLAFIAAFYI